MIDNLFRIQYNNAQEETVEVYFGNVPANFITFDANVNTSLNQKTRVDVKFVLTQQFDNNATSGLMVTVRCFDAANAIAVLNLFNLSPNVKN